MVLITCVYAPFTLAFIDEMPIGITILDIVTNCIFLLDIFVNMLSGYFDDEMLKVTNLKVRGITNSLIFRKLQQTT